MQASFAPWAARTIPGSWGGRSGRFTAHDVTDAGDGTLRLRGELEAAGSTVPLSLEAPVRELDGELEVEATTLVDQRRFGMTWSPLGTVRSPSTLRVRARLTPSGT